MDFSRPRSYFTIRAILALLLTSGYYLLALGLMAGSTYLVYLSGKLTGTLCPIVCLPWFIINLSIIYSIFPRSSNIKPVGLLITSLDQPKLFELIHGAAQAMHQAVPDEVYLVPDPVTFVTEQRTLVLFRGKHILAIGLPLLAALNRSQVLAVIIHELGHFASGDTFLGGWIYGTRAAIERSIQSMASWLKFPFQWYGKLFLAVTRSFSRRQELEADRQSALLAGTATTREALIQTYLLGELFRSYTMTEFSPVFSNGFYPPFTEGFAYFLNTRAVQKTKEENLSHHLAEEEDSQLGSHPSLRLRLQGIENTLYSDQAAAIIDTSPGLSLLNNVYQLDLEMMKLSNGPN